MKIANIYVKKYIYIYVNTTNIIIMVMRIANHAGCLKQEEEALI